MICEVQKITAPNGKPSALYSNIYDHLQDQSQALDVWLQTRSQDFMTKFGDWMDNPEEFKDKLDENGEPKFDEIYEGGTFILTKPEDVNNLVGYNSLREIIVEKLDNAIRQGRGIYKRNGNYYITADKFAAGTSVLAEINRVHKFVRSSPTRIGRKEVNRVFIEEAAIKGFVKEFDNRDKEANEVPELNLATTADMHNLLEAQDADKFTTLITRLRERKRILELKRTEDPKRSAELKARIDTLEREIEALQLQRSNSAIKTIAREHVNEIRSHLDVVENNVHKELTTEQILSLMNNLMENSYFIKGWLDIKEEFLNYEEGTDLEKEVAAIKNDFENLYKRYLELQKSLFVKYANLESYKDDFTEDQIFGYLADTNKLTSKFLSSTASNSELVKITTDVLKNAAFLANKEYNEKRKDIEKVIRQNEKVTGEQGEKAWDWVAQKYKNGEKTGNLISPYKQEYFDTRKKKSEEARKTGNWKTFFEWLDANTNTITEKEATSGKSTVFTQEELDRQKDLLDKYEVERAAYKQALEDKGLGSDQIELEMVLWEDIWSPYVYWEFLGGEISYKPGRQGHQYHVYAKPKDQWHDSTFKKFVYDVNTNKVSNQERYDIYEFIMNTLQDNNKKLPLNHRQQRNYLPELQKDMTFMEQLKNAPDFVKKAFTEEAEKDIETRIEIQGRVIKNIPIHMMDARMDIQEKSLDVGRILMKHTEMALSYKYKSDIQVVADAAKDFVDEMKEAQENQNKNTYKRTVFGQTILRNNKLYNTKEHLEYAINAYLYNEYRDKGEYAAKGKVYTNADKKVLKELGVSPKEIKQKLEELEVAYKKGELTEEEFKAQASRLNGLGRVVTGGAIGDTLIKYTYLKALAFPNVVSPFVNLAFGLISNHIYAASGVDYTTKELMSGLSTLLAASSGKIGKAVHKEAVEKVFAWMETLDLLGDSIVDTAYGGTKSISDKAVFLQTNAEKINQGSVMVAMLKHQKIQDKDGNQVSLWEAYKIDKEGKLVWNTELIGKQGEMSQQSILNEEGDSVNLYRLGNKIGAVVARIHGDYKSPMAAKRDIIMRSMMLFRTWLPASLEERFGKQRFDQELGRYRRGRYGSFVSPKNSAGERLGFNTTLKTLLKIMTFQKNNFGEISDVDLENIKKDLTEIMYIASLMTVAILLRGFLEDDEEKREILNLLANTQSRIAADLMFALNPGSAGQIVDNAVPIYRTVKDFFGIYGVAMKALQGDFYFKNGYYKDRLRIEKWALGNLPGTSAGMRTYGLSQQLYDYN